MSDETAGVVGPDRSAEPIEGELELLLRYLQNVREALLFKLEGLSEYDIRRPLTPTGTNLLGLVKHVASVEHGYFSGCFGRAQVFETPWFDDDAPDNADMWATEEESRDFVVGLYRQAWVADDAAVRELGLDAPREPAGRWQRSCCISTASSSTTSPRSACCAICTCTALRLRRRRSSPGRDEAPARALCRPCGKE